MGGLMKRKPGLNPLIVLLACLLGVVVPVATIV
jgi:hypothetical protein